MKLFGTFSSSSNIISSTSLGGSYSTMAICNSSGSTNVSSVNTYTYQNSYKMKIEVLGKEVELYSYGIDQQALILITNLNFLGYQYWKAYKSTLESTGLSHFIPSILIEHIEDRCKILEREARIDTLTDDIKIK